jgi:phosphoglycerol transferase MdoB-like AlkP superfamily enzyme
LRYFFYFLRPFFFFVILFAFYRLLFLLVFVLPLPEVHLGGVLLSFWYGLKLDLAVSSYILFLPVLLWLFSFPAISSACKKITRIYFALVVVLIHIGSFSNLVVYHYWDSLLNWRALSYLSDPGEAAASVSLIWIVLWFLFLIVVSIFSIRFFFRKVHPAESPAPSSFFPRLVYFIFFSGLLLLLARGGWQLIPINESAAYFSPVRQLNDAATNSLWHLGHSAKVAGSHDNPFVTMSPAEAERTVDSLYAVQDSAGDEILTLKKPNIVLLILESYSSDLLGCMGAKVSAAPFLDSLAGQGMLFTNIYSSGFRTDQGLTALLSGFPATPIFSVIRYPEKTAALPSLVKALTKDGYFTSYYYGGSGNFRNMKSYCYNMGFQKYTDQENLPSGLPQCKWGIHDEFVLQRQAEDLSQVKQPFFSVVMTLSNHEPYDVPMQVHFKGNDNSQMFRNSAYYTDRSLQKYFVYAAKQAWYANTLFVIVADHGHHLPEKRDMSGPESHHLPLIFFGKALKPSFVGTRIPLVGNHHDLPATLLRQLNLRSNDFRWSKNLLSKGSISFAYYEQEDGFGWIRDDEWVYYSVLQKRPVRNGGNPQKEAGSIISGKAFLQQLYEQFLKF